MRTYKRKTTRCSYTTQDLNNAAKAVNEEEKSVNAAAKEFGIKKNLETDGPEQAVMSNTEPNPTSYAATNQAEPEPGPSNKENEPIDLTHVFSPEIVRPYQRAGPRKAANTNRRKRKSAILTDTPENNALEEQQNKTRKKVIKPRKNKDNKRKSVCKKVLQSSDESDDDDYSCLICCEGYSESLPGETWIQCQVCKGWAHTKCVPGAGFTFVCINCNSDNND